jgi:hypothetical protein
MSRIRRFTLASLIVAAIAVPALAQENVPPSDQPQAQPPPYSPQITTPPNVTVSPTVTVTPATPAPTPPTAQPVIIQPAPPPAATPPQSVVVEQKPVNVSVVPLTKPEPIMAISLGGGISEFADSKIRDRTGVSGEYEARVLFGVNSPLAFEAAYVGTASALTGLSGESNATLVSNGVEGLARLNIGTYQIQPFVVGGAGWTRYNVVNTKVSLSDIRDSDDVLAIPFGAGVSSYIPDTGFMIDARFIYRATFDDELVRPTASNTTGAGLENWNVSLRVGYVF